MRFKYVIHMADSDGDQYTTKKDASSSSEAVSIAQKDNPGFTSYKAVLDTQYVVVKSVSTALASMHLPKKYGMLANPIGVIAGDVCGLVTGHGHLDFDTLLSMAKHSLGFGSGPGGGSPRRT